MYRALEHARIDIYLSFEFEVREYTNRKTSMFLGGRFASKSTVSPWVMFSAGCTPGWNLAIIAIGKTLGSIFTVDSVENGT